MSEYYVYAGRTLSGIMLGYNDSMYVSSGGSATMTPISSGGWMYVRSGGRTAS